MKDRQEEIEEFGLFFISHFGDFFLRFDFDDSLLLWQANFNSPQKILSGTSVPKMHYFWNKTFRISYRDVKNLVVTCNIKQYIQ